jgi:U4/U6.U5 tri-snRNP component SNU23
MMMMMHGRRGGILNLDGRKLLHRIDAAMASHAVKATSENRTWDDAEYENLARERREQARQEKINKIAAKESVAVREENLLLEKNVGTRTKFNAHPDAKRTGKGFWCETCEMEFLDSSSYVTHLNSRFHQSKLGKSMLITESTLSDVKQKLLQHKKRRREELEEANNQRATSGSGSSRYTSSSSNSKQLTKAEIYELKKKKLEDEKRERKKQKRLEKKRQKECSNNDNNCNNNNTNVNNNQDDDVDSNEKSAGNKEIQAEEEESEEMKQMKLMMGFGSFN